jgi:hypothetical protein
MKISWESPLEGTSFYYFLYAKWWAEYDGQKCTGTKTNESNNAGNHYYTSMSYTSRTLPGTSCIEIVRITTKNEDDSIQGEAMMPIDYSDAFTYHPI